MNRDNPILHRIYELRESADAIGEHIGERLTQYQSEVALYGDAGHGQHPSVWQPRLQAHLKKIEDELDALYQTPEGKALRDEEQAEFERSIADLYADPTTWG